MPTYSLNAVNVGSFPLGESDKVLTVFSAERGLVRAVAKGARKPGAKIAGKAELLQVNRLLLAKGRSLDIITQAESLESFRGLRTDLIRLTYCLYYAELTLYLGQGLEDESASYFDFLRQSIKCQADMADDAASLCLSFELELLAMLGYMPELNVCVGCRRPITEANLSIFHHELGGVLCDRCLTAGRSETGIVAERGDYGDYGTEGAEGAEGLSSRLSRTSSFDPTITHLTPLVWKRLILAASQPVLARASLPSSSLDAGNLSPAPAQNQVANPAIARATDAARRLMQLYIEHRAGRKMKSLDLISSLR